MTDDEIEERLGQIEKRLDRLDRLAYVAFDDVRQVAEYAYRLAIRPPEEPGDRPVRRMSHMQPLSEAEAARSGLDVQHRLVMKSIWKALGFAIRRDALTISREMAQRIMAKADEPVEVSHDSDLRTRAGR